MMVIFIHLYSLTISNNKSKIKISFLKSTIYNKKPYTIYVILVIKKLGKNKWNKNNN